MCMMYTWEGKHSLVHMWRSRDIFVELILSFLFSVDS